MEMSCVHLVVMLLETFLVQLLESEELNVYIYQFQLSFKVFVTNFHFGKMREHSLPLCVCINVFVYLSLSTPKNKHYHKLNSRSLNGSGGSIVWDVARH